MANSQWRAECDCLPEVAESRDTQEWIRMHTERGQNDDGGKVIECNICGDRKVVGEDEGDDDDIESGQTILGS